MARWPKKRRAPAGGAPAKPEPVETPVETEQTTETVSASISVDIDALMDLPSEPVAQEPQQRPKRLGLPPIMESLRPDDIEAQINARLAKQ